jgi:Alpha amylase, catalytic domain
MAYVPWMGRLMVNGTSGNYGTVKLLLDERADPATRPLLTVRVEIARGGLHGGDFEVEVYTNLNRRDFVKTFEPLGDAGLSASSYWLLHRAEHVGDAFDNLVYEVRLPVTACGAYRLTTRYRRRGDALWWWHNEFSPVPHASLQRDCAIVVSPSKAATRRIYEANVLTVEALYGGDYHNRSTLDDFLPTADFDGFNPFDLEYVRKQLGFNTLWLMPLFPATRWRWDVASWRWIANDAPGSPYSVRDYWSINPFLGDRAGSERARTLFRDVVAQAGEQDLDVFLDIAFNHAGRDVVLGRGAVELGLCAEEDAGDAVREVRPSWCTRGSEHRDGGFVPHYRERAHDDYACALWAPTDRVNEHVWDDANVDWYFGDYSTLGPKPGRGADHLGNPFSFSDGRGNAEDERDLFYTDLGQDRETEALWRYMAHILPYWLHQTGEKLAGVRADFAQGLPNHLWEYVINSTRKVRWDFVFLAEVLDPDPVQYRLNRVFDVLTTKDHYLYRKSDLSMHEVVNSLEAEARLFGPECVVMHNGTSHDEHGNPDRWAMVARYALCAALHGTPMIYMGQPLGISHKLEFRSSWANMYEAWTREDPERESIARMYLRINEARERTPELRGAARYFLALQSGGFHPRIFAAARWLPSEAGRAITLVFVNLDPAHGAHAHYVLPPSLELRGRYNLVNLVAVYPARSLWHEDRTASSLQDEGLAVRLDYPNEVQYLKLVPR